jgi:hypothetical protein
MADIITVAELIERLQHCDQDSVVYLKCTDDYYSGPLTTDAFSHGSAYLVGPFEWKEPKEDERGRPIAPRVHRHPGGWCLETDARHTVLEKRSCLVVNVE